MKVPLFLQSMVSEMLESKMKNGARVNLQEDICNKMLKVIKDRSKNLPMNLYSSIKNYEEITQQVTDFENRLSSKEFQGKSEKEIEDSLGAFQRLITEINYNMKKNLKKEL